jgi:glycosyltransferase involved in cell wall biosynthesis
MPVYNAVRFVAQATQSVLAQTFADFEFVILDDGSTDGSKAILDHFARRDPRVRFVSRQHKGLVATLNEGLALATAPLVARMDADDLCDAKRVELQVAALNVNPALVAVGCWAAVIDEDGSRLGDFMTPLTHEQIETYHLRGDSAIHHPSVMFRAEAVRELGGYRDFVTCQDFDLWLRLGEVGRLANLPERLITKRLFPGSIVATTLDERQAVLAQIMADAWRRRNLPGSPPRPRQPIADHGDLFRQWGWMALKSGQVATSRRHARRALRAQPFHRESWLLMACALRGRWQPDASAQR